MKKRLIAAALAVIVVAVSVLLFVKLKDKNAQAQTTALQTEATTYAFQQAQLGVTVDGWLKIVSIEEYNGTLAVVAENVSDQSVEYAVLSVKTKNATLTFNVSALLSGMQALLICNENAACDPGEVYTAWQTKDLIAFEKPPVMNEDEIEVSVADGSISVKNISGKDISSDIYIYYKEKDGELLNGSFTGRTRVSGIKADSQTFIKAPALNADNCQIIFTEYDD